MIDVIKNEGRERVGPNLNGYKNLKKFHGSCQS
jgi:hypothetical protein